jgi:hypothetical protein
VFTLCSLCSSFDAQVVRHRNCPGNASSTRKGEDCEDREDVGGMTSHDVALTFMFSKVPCCVSRALHCQVDFTAPLRAALLVRRATLSSDEVLRDPDRYPWVLCPSARTTCTESVWFPRSERNRHRNRLESFSMEFASTFVWFQADIRRALVLDPSCKSAQEREMATRKTRKATEKTYVAA